MSRRMMMSIQPGWCLALPIQQQSVLLLAARGPDGVAKAHPCKDVQRAYRGCVMVAARKGRLLDWGERADSFMCLETIAGEGWAAVVDRFWEHADSLPHHFLLHLVHGAEILGYKHPLSLARARWASFYARACNEMHMNPETEDEMDARLSDWGQEGWEE